MSTIFATNPIKNILVGLDLSAIDNTLIKYTSFIAEKLQVEKVYFVHNIKRYEFSNLFSEALDDINLDDVVGEELNDKIEENFTSTIEWEVLISDDPYTESLFNYIVNKYAIQLTIVGNKNTANGSGVLSNKLLKLLKCHILSVPKNTLIKLEKTWVGTDFSMASKKAFGVAEYIKSKQEDTKVNAVYVYKIPLQFSHYLPTENMASTIKKHATEKGARFMRKLKLDQKYDLEIYRKQDISISQRLNQEGQKENIDLLIVADKGSNTFSSLLVGSVTEDLFNELLHFPLWVAKY
ncbi:nucleotide-binding universal stress UspA family protein [Mesonia hippocampi]|uniref:Nucleotide-binding universal stress UspA family protein n=1 Tax=Mesonia hippocampi TaxID=1628250 RepID=A0A840EQW8_9FLAO|nr:universal stress protein [Mesonia hippocampi]MBB4118973.1 nucleotide-binding universal stress UspA family protein [Mesonia hippocampi]